MTPCHYPHCRRESCVTLIDAPLCRTHWDDYCEIEDEQAARLWLAKIGLTINEEKETVKKGF